MAGVKVYTFVFAEWIMMIGVGVLIYTSGKYTLESDMTNAWYKITIGTLLSGGLSLQTVESIRIWYWNYFYKLEALEQVNTQGDEETVFEGDEQINSTPNAGMDFKQKPAPYVEVEVEETETEIAPKTEAEAEPEL